MQEFFGFEIGEKIYGTYRGVGFVGDLKSEYFNEKTLDYGWAVKLDQSVSGERICTRDAGELLTILPRTSVILGRVLGA